MERFAKYLALLLLCSGCVNDLNKVEALNARGAGVEVAKNIKTFYYGVNGHLKGVLTAPLLYRYTHDTPHVELNEGLHVDFYNDSMQVQSVLTARKGVYYENSNNIIVRDSVVVTSMGGKRVLRTEELFWDPKKQQFYTYKPATLTTPAQTIVGKNGLMAPADLSWYKFMNASGELKVDSGYYSPLPADTARAGRPATSPPPGGGDSAERKDTVTQRPGT